MSWEAIAAIGQTLGALGVIASLLYLAAQVRQNNRAAAVAAKLAATRQLTNFADTLIADPKLMDPWLRGGKGLGSLDEVERFRFANMCLKAFWFFSAAEYQLRIGTLDGGNRAESYAVIRFWLDGEGLRSWWQKTGRARFGSGFVLFIDREIARPGGSR